MKISKKQWEEVKMRNNIAYDSLNEVVKMGLELLNKYHNELTEDLFKIWFDYSIKVLDMLSGYNRFSKSIDPSIQINYLRLAIQLASPYLTATQKLTSCLNYLIEVMNRI